MNTEISVDLHVMERLTIGRFGEWRHRGVETHLERPDPVRQVDVGRDDDAIRAERPR